jgi:hypothetical protein
LRQYKPLALFAAVLWLPVALIGIAEAAKTPKPVYALQSDLDVVSNGVVTLDAEVAGLSGQVNQNTADIALLDSEVEGLSGQVNQNTADIAIIYANRPAFPRRVLFDANGLTVEADKFGFGFSVSPNDDSVAVAGLLRYRITENWSIAGELEQFGVAFGGIKEPLRLGANVEYRF